MKKKNKKKLSGYWLGTRKPTSLGYQPNYGIGNAQFTSVEGEDLTPEANAARRNVMPNALGKLSQQGMGVSNILSNTTKLAPTAAANAALNATVQNMVQSMPALPSTQVLATAAENNLLQAAPKTVLSGAGKALAGLGAAYGAYSMFNDFANAGDIRSAGDMRNTASTNTYTTAGGNQYTQYGGIDAGAERRYERAQRDMRRVGLTLDAAGTGASIGSLVAPGIGTAIGAGAGVLFGGLASLFGFGDNSDELEQQMIDTTNTLAMENKQRRSTAESDDVKQAFYGRAANGKQPVWSPEGLVNRKATARVSNGELIGNFEDGYVSRVPGKKNNKDTKLANLKDSDFVISNKYGLSDYAAATGDYEGALNMQNMLMSYKNGKKPCCKCGKLPKHALGTLGEYALATLPHMAGFFSNLGQYNRAKHADTYVPQFEIQNPESAAAINQVMSDMIDPREYLNQSNKTYRQSLWNTQRTPGMGLGGRAIMADALTRAKLAQDAETRMKIDEANRGQRNLGAQMRDRMGQDLLSKRYDNMWRRHAAAQQANAAKENWLAQYRKNMDTAIGDLGADALRMIQYNQARDQQNKMLGIYQQQVDLDKMRLLKEFPETTTPAASAYVPDTKQYMKLTNPFAPTSIYPQYSMYKAPQLSYPYFKLNVR